jgi:uroporphyrinogen decarboxylase
VDERLENLREFILPENWEQKKAVALEAGCQVPLYRHQRGPVTFATSIYGTENLVFLLVDNPALGARFRDTILRAMLERGRIMLEENTQTPEERGAGFAFADDNCALLNPQLYEFFGYPILKGVFDEFAPEPGDWRFQHSDSDMGHLLPVLGRLNLTACNFGPTVLVEDIREHMPHTIVKGCLAPFTFSRNEEVNIVAEFLRDYEMARESKGLVFATAGSINEGSRLTGMRLAMAAIQRWGRYV